MIIGAGAAGLMAGYSLSQHGVEFKILEASSNFGGRVKKLEGFADFPIDLGAEWIHTDPSVFSELIGADEAQIPIELIKYNPGTISVWEDGVLQGRDFFSLFYSEYKFKSTTWYDFFDAYVVPPIAKSILLNKEVVEIDYSGDPVLIRTSDGEVFTASRVILSVPLTALKQDLITFVPPLPERKTTALSQVEMPDGIKMFFKFSERFYPDITLDGGLLKNLSTIEEGEKTIYDAAFKKNSQMNVLGLFSVGKPASVYVRQEEESLVSYFLEELDTMFDGRASRSYVDHVVQNWSNEPFIRGSYSHYTDYDAKRVLAEPIADKVFFAGEAYAADSDLATVHGAGRSGSKTVNAILASMSASRA